MTDIFVFSDFQQHYGGANLRLHFHFSIGKADSRIFSIRGLHPTLGDNKESLRISAVSVHFGTAREGRRRGGDTLIWMSCGEANTSCFGRTRITTPTLGNTNQVRQIYEYAE